jgi:hypothetical protein
MLPPLTAEQRELYYAESWRFAALFGIPRECLPRDWTAFSAYIEEMTRSDTLTVTDARAGTGRNAGRDQEPVQPSFNGLTGTTRNKE